MQENEIYLSLGNFDILTICVMYSFHFHRLFLYRFCDIKMPVKLNYENYTICNG